MTRGAVRRGEVMKVQEGRITPGRGAGTPRTAEEIRREVRREAGAKGEEKTRDEKGVGRENEDCRGQESKRGDSKRD